MTTQTAAARTRAFAPILVAIAVAACGCGARSALATSDSPDAGLNDSTPPPTTDGPCNSYVFAETHEQPLPTGRTSNVSLGLFNLSSDIGVFEDRWVAGCVSTQNDAGCYVWPIARDGIWKAPREVPLPRPPLYFDPPAGYPGEPFVARRGGEAVMVLGFPGQGSDFLRLSPAGEVLSTRTSILPNEFLWLDSDPSGGYLAAYDVAKATFFFTHLAEDGTPDRPAALVPSPMARLPDGSYLAISGQLDVLSVVRVSADGRVGSAGPPVGTYDGAKGSPWLSCAYVTDRVVCLALDGGGWPAKVKVGSIVIAADGTPIHPLTWQTSAPDQIQHWVPCSAGKDVAIGGYVTIDGPRRLELFFVDREGLVRQRITRPEPGDFVSTVGVDAHGNDASIILAHGTGDAHVLVAEHFVCR
jgi:hypothetical protein